MAIEKSFPVLGDHLEVLVGSASTNNAFNVVTQTCRPGAGVPPHVHTNEDEFFVPVYGQFEMFDGQGWVPLDPTGVFMRRGTVHGFRNAGPEPAKIMIFVTPGGFERFLEKLSPLTVPENIPELIAISADYGITYPGLAQAA